MKTYRVVLNYKDKTEIKRTPSLQVAKEWGKKAESFKVFQKRWEVDLNG